jgi:hypothetical protein
MKKLVVILILSIPFIGISQIGGDIKKDGRALKSDKAFVIEDSHEGTIVFNISVNAEGEITATKIDPDKTTIKSTPAKIKARNYIADFKFAPGTWYPKYHQGTIRLTMIKQK